MENTLTKANATPASIIAHSARLPNSALLALRASSFRTMPVYLNAQFRATQMEPNAAIAKSPAPAAQVRPTINAPLAPLGPSSLIAAA